MLSAGILLAFLASVFFGLGIALQAADAATIRTQSSVGLMTHLVRRRRWLVGTALGAVAWGIQAAALLFAPLTIVQPMLTFSLVVILLYGARRLGRSIGITEWIGVAAIAGGVVGLSLVSPARTDLGGSALVLSVVTLGFAVLTVAPWALKWAGRPSGFVTTLGAGLSYAWAGLTLKLFSDDISPSLVLGGAALWAVIWVVAVVASLVLEMTAYQTHPARQVAPTLFVLQMAVPVLLEPVIGQFWPHTVLTPIFLLIVAVGAVVLARSKSVSSVVHAGSTGRSTEMDRHRAPRLASTV